MIEIAYEDLLSGDLIPLNQIGHIRQPKLKELKPTSGIGVQKYNSYINTLYISKEELLSSSANNSDNPFEKISKDETVNTFDILTLAEELKGLLQEALTFFMHENISWDKASYRFILSDKNTGVPTGYINRENYDQVRSAILKVNYINTEKKATPIKFVGDKAKELWVKAQEYKKKYDIHTDGYDALGNIISKLCASSATYSLLNVYDLTIYQLYDQYAQSTYLRVVKINEEIFCNHGGKNFDFRDWQKPIT